MTDDNLRDRIAAVIWERIQVRGGRRGMLRISLAEADFLADAVIAELARSECGGDLCECRQCRVIRIMEADDQ